MLSVQVGEAQRGNVSSSQEITESRMGTEAAWTSFPGDPFVEFHR